jgi:hypothetical protein
MKVSTNLSNIWNSCGSLHSALQSKAAVDTVLFFKAPGLRQSDRILDTLSRLSKNEHPQFNVKEG